MRARSAAISAPTSPRKKSVRPARANIDRRRGQRRLPAHCAGLGRLAVAQEHGGETRHVLELRKLLGSQPGLAAGHRRAVAGMPDRGIEQGPQRQAAAESFCEFQCQHPPGHRPRRRQRR